jgi:hypothetical protein
VAGAARHLQRIDDETRSGCEPRSTSPDAAAERVDDRSEIHLAFTGRIFGDVHDPESVGAGRVELAADEIVVGDRGRTAPCAAPPRRR